MLTKQVTAEEQGNALKAREGQAEPNLDASTPQNDQAQVRNVDV